MMGQAKSMMQGQGDGKLHDIFPPLTSVHPDTPVTVTVYNYDTGEHSFTAQALGVKNIVKRAQKRDSANYNLHVYGQKTGSYTWACVVPCDDNAGGCAMSQIYDC